MGCHRLLRNIAEVLRNNNLPSVVLSIIYVPGRASQVALVVKNLPANTGDVRNSG